MLRGISSQCGSEKAKSHGVNIKRVRYLRYHVSINCGAIPAWPLRDVHEGFHFERTTHQAQPARYIISEAVQETVDVPLLAIGRVLQL
jgi:hypothetical protein